jgi:hypothetical protein
LTGLLAVPALALVTMAGYSAGAALGSRGRPPAVSLADPLLVAALWAAVFALRGTLGRPQAMGAAILLGLAAGALAFAVRPRAAPAAALPGDGPARGAWARFAGRMGNFNGRLLMAFFYFLVLPPFALVVRLSKGGGGARVPGSFWRERPGSPPRLEDAGKQF